MDRNLFISSFKHGVLKVFKAAAFVVLIASVIIFLENVLENSDDVSRRKKAIDATKANGADILIIGNSHAYCTFDPSVIERATGKRVFNAGLPDQKIDTAYCNLIEMLKKQKPEVVVLEAFTFGRSNTEYEGYIANIDAMSLNLNKMATCYNIFPNKLDAFRMCFRLFRAHNNWKDTELMKKKFKTMLGLPAGLPDIGTGFYSLKSKMSKTTIKKYENSTTSKFTAEIDNYSTAYFYRIAKLCRSKGIRLIVTMAPFNNVYLKKIHYESIHDKIAGICSNAGIEFIDFNMLYDKLGLGFDDFEDAFHNSQHTNIWGAQKVSGYFSNYLLSSSRK